MTGNGMNRLEGLSFTELKETTKEKQEMPKWGRVNVHLVTADGRMPENTGSMHWRVSSWPIAKSSNKNTTWKHLIDRVRGGELA